jgi:hypothetical protein
MANVRPIALNPKTGERFMQVGGTWYPMSKGTLAANPKTGEQFFLAGDTWVPISTTPTPGATDKKPGKRDALGAGMTLAGSQLTAGLPYAIEKLAGTLTPDEEEDYLRRLRAARDKAEEQLPGGAPSIEDLAQGNAGLGALLLENLAVSAPQMGASIVGGLAGAAAGTVVAPGAGTVAGGVAGVLGGTVASTPFFVGSNVDRATEGGTEKLTKSEAAKSVAVAPVQAGVETVAERFVPGLGRVFGAPVKKVVGEAATKAASKPVQTFLTQTAKGAVKGAAEEAITEPLQQVGERFAAELPLADEEARKEYLVSGLTAGLVGAPVGAVGAQFERKVEPPATGATATAMGLSPEEARAQTREEFQRIFESNLATVQAENPQFTPEEARAEVMTRRNEMLAEAASNVWERANATTEPTEEGAPPTDVGAGVDVSAPSGAGVSVPVGGGTPGQAPTMGGVPDLGPVADVEPAVVPPVAGEAEQPGALTPKVKMPMKERVAQWKATLPELASEMGVEIPEGTKLAPLARQLAQKAAKGLEFDPVTELKAYVGQPMDLAPEVAPTAPVAPPKIVPSLEQAKAATVETPLAPTAAPAPAPAAPPAPPPVAAPPPEVTAPAPEPIQPAPVEEIAPPEPVAPVSAPPPTPGPNAELPPYEVLSYDQSVPAEPLLEPTPRPAPPTEIDQETQLVNDFTRRLGEAPESVEVFDRGTSTPGLIEDAKNIAAVQAQRGDAPLTVDQIEPSLQESKANTADEANSASWFFPVTLNDGTQIKLYADEAPDGGFEYRVEDDLYDSASLANYGEANRDVDNPLVPTGGTTKKLQGKTLVGDTQFLQRIADHVAARRNQVMAVAERELKFADRQREVSAITREGATKEVTKRKPLYTKKEALAAKEAEAGTAPAAPDLEARAPKHAAAIKRAVMGRKSLSKATPEQVQMLNDALKAAEYLSPEFLERFLARKKANKEPFVLYGPTKRAVGAKQEARQGAPQPIKAESARGALTTEYANAFTTWVNNVLPVLNTVKLELQEGTGLVDGTKNLPLGVYDPKEHIVRLYGDVIRHYVENPTATDREDIRDTLLVHELLHGMERVLTPGLQSAIRAQWLKQVNALLASVSDAPSKEFLQLARARTRDARQKASQMWAKGDVPFDYYQYINPSEFWAVNATSILQQRFKDGFTPEQLTLLQKAVKFFRDIADRLTGKDNPVVRALDSLAKSDGKFRSRDVLDLISGRPQMANRTEVEADAEALLGDDEIDRILRDISQQRSKGGEFEERVRLSRSASEMANGAGGLAATFHNRQQGLDTLTAVWRSLTGKGMRTVVRALTTDDLTVIAKRLGLDVKRVNSAVEQVATDRIGALQLLEEHVRKWDAFNKKSEAGGQLLADVMAMSVRYDVDPTRAPSARAYMAVDEALQSLRSNPNPDRAAIAEREEEIRRVYQGANTAEHEVIGGWNDLAKAEFGGGEGKRIFAMVKDAYKGSLDRHYDLIKQWVEASHRTEERRAEVMSQIDEMFAPAFARTVYFPFMRHGRFWVSVGTGEKSEFYLFESETQRNLFQIQRERELRDAKDRREVNIGNDLTGLRSRMVEEKSASAALNSVLGMLDNGIPDVDAFKDSIFQMYLQTLPEGDMRRRFLTVKYKTGWSTDALRNFVVSQNAAASQLARLGNGYKIRAAVSQLEDLLKSRSTDEGDDAPVERLPNIELLEPIVKELKLRAIEEITPNYSKAGEIDWDKLGALGTKTVFIMMMTSPKTAIIQLTQLPLVGMPVLSGRFGAAKSIGMMNKYMGNFLTLKQFSFTHKDRDGEVITRTGDISMRESRYIKDLEASDPVRHAAMLQAWNYANIRNIFMSTFSGDLNDRTRESTTEFGVGQALKQGRYASALSQGVRSTFNFMGAAFQMTERASRELMFMASFELAYDKKLASGMRPDAAVEAASKEAAELTNEALFNYTYYNRPRIAKQGLWRIPFQFQMFPMQMTSYLVRNFLGMMPMLNEKAERKEAANKFFGTMLMTGMVAGVPGMGLIYMSTAAVAQAALGAWKEATGDEDDDPTSALSGVDLDTWFRSYFIPEMFGAGSGVAQSLGLSPEDAAMLARMWEFGPVGALTDLSIQPSTSISSLWFSQDLRSDTLLGKTQEAFFNTLLGPAGGLVRNAATAVDYMQQGDGARAAEYVVPAFFRGAITAQRLDREGLVTKSGVPVMPPEFYSFAKLSAQTAGFGSTEAYQAQRENVELKGISKKIDAKATLLVRQYVAAQTRYNSTDGQNGDAFAKIMDDITEFNTENPLYAIGLDTLGEAATRKAEEQAGAIKGLTLDPKNPLNVYVGARRVEEAQ